MTIPDNKKVLVLLGSPRKNGNSAALGRQIAKGAKDAGAEVDIVQVNDLKIRPCQACYGCRKEGAEGCVLKDDMQILYPKLRESQAIAIASPVYWFNMSAQIKAVMDRWFALGAGEYRDLAGKKVAVAMSYQDADPFSSGAVNALRVFQDSFRYVEANLIGMVYGQAHEPGEIAGNMDLMRQAEELGRDLASQRLARQPA